MAGSVIVNGARTPMGRLLGSLKDFSGADLGGVAIKAALERSGVSPDQVQYVIMGQVLQAGVGQIPARQAAHKAGIGLDVPALTINKVCLSGLDAIALADQLIRAGEFDIVHSHTAALLPLVETLPIPVVHAVHLAPTPQLIDLYAAQPHARYVCISGRQAELLGNAFARPPQVIHHGLDTTRYPGGDGSSDEVLFLG